MKIKSYSLTLLCFISVTNGIGATPFHEPPRFAQQVQDHNIFGLPPIKADVTLPEIPKRRVSREYLRRIRNKKDSGCYSFGRAVGEFVTDAFGDIFNLHINLFSWDSFKIITTAFPVFIAARMVDEKLQRCFYDSSCHKNINQMPKWCHDLAKASIAVPLVLLGSAAFLSRDDEWRWTGQILILGMPFVIWTKKLVKQMKFEACRRPWHEDFSCEERSFGGFPSGHMAQALYMAVLYGTRYGPRLAVPLGLIAGMIGVTFVTCNRHFLSQVVGGAAFGTIYALAANKIVEKKLTDRVELAIMVDERGKPTFSAGVSW